MNLIHINRENSRAAIPVDKIDRISLSLHDVMGNWVLYICINKLSESYEFESREEAIRIYEEIINAIEDLN